MAMEGPTFDSGAFQCTPPLDPPVLGRSQLFVSGGGGNPNRKIGPFCDETPNALNAFSQKMSKIFGEGPKNVHGDFCDGTQGRHASDATLPYSL